MQIELDDERRKEERDGQLERDVAEELLIQSEPKQRASIDAVRLREQVQSTAATTCAAYRLFVMAFDERARKEDSGHQSDHCDRRDLR